MRQTFCFIAILSYIFVYVQGHLSHAKPKTNLIKTILMKKTLSIIALSLCMITDISAQPKSLHQLQQEFVDLQFGMFIHFNIPTFAPEDWPDPDLPAAVFNPRKLDCSQWARAAKSANMSYGCLTTKHHSGFCIWDTQTTDYCVKNSPFKRDVVREYVDAFRAEGLEVMLYYSILDTHHRLRRHMINDSHIDLVKAQLKELLTNYGPIKALIIDGWDAPWSRISYDEIPFHEIYDYIKSIQPECLVMDLNAAKYPSEALFYTDIKSYEQGAGQHISTSENRFPALACLSIQNNWFWKKSFPTDQLKSPKWLVEENIVPYGKAYCNFILNVAPNPDGLMDDNALEALKEIGTLWKNRGRIADIPTCEAPIIERNIAKHRPSESTWSWDGSLMDYANDDNFGSAWIANALVEVPVWQVELSGKEKIDMITITEERGGVMEEYRIEYRRSKSWTTLFEGKAKDQSRVKIHRFAPVKADAVKITITKRNDTVKLSEVGVYTPEY